MKITLCYPATVPGYKPKYSLQPLGVLYIAALLKREGFEVEVIDGDINGLSVQETTDRILDSEPDLVGFSLMTPHLMTGLACSALLKHARPDLPIVLGGAHFDSTKEDTFQIADCFDIIVSGEGEYALLEICRNMEHYGANEIAKACEGVGNAIYRNDEGEVVINPSRAFLRELDVLPSVDYDMLDIRKYNLPNMAGRYVISMMLSRGCPFKCSFCDAPITMGKKLRFWSIERVIRDIRFYRDKYGCTNFVFKDSTFTASKKWAKEFCNALLEADLNIKWRCNARANQVPEELLNLMGRAGCYVINFGVESGDAEILRRIRKEVDIESVVDAFERCRNLGIRTYATFMVGSPGETNETVRVTIDFAKRLRSSFCSFGIATAYPGTPMYDEALADGQIEPRWWARQSFDLSKNSAFQIRWGWTNAGALKIPGFDAEYWQRRATREWYLRPRFMWDTALFILANPYFLRHVLNLAGEVLPFYKLRNLFPRRKISGDDRLEIFQKCPSQPWPDVERVVAAPSRIKATGLTSDPRDAVAAPDRKSTR